MAKITRRAQPAVGEREVIKVKTMTGKTEQRVGAWWNASNKKEAADMLLGTAGFLKEQNQYRMRQVSIHAQLYGNMPLVGAFGSYASKLGGKNPLPIDRPTMSVITSCIDTLVARITQSRPRPVFLTDNGDYKQRNLAKQLNQFIAGEFYQTKAYEKLPYMLRDACVTGTGVLKVVETADKRAGLERRMATELLTDTNDALYGEPRQLYEIQLVDRDVFGAAFPKAASLIDSAEKAYPDQSGESAKTVSDQIMVVEGWHLPSSPDSKDGCHMIACTEGEVFSDNWIKKTFPFAFLPFSPRLLGFWAQGLSEQLMGTQVEINKLLMTISRAINLVGVPRVFMDQGSKVVSAHFNNEVGGIIKFMGTKPSFEVAPCMPAEVYAQLQRLVEYAYQQSGISSLAAQGKKPAGLNSGAAMREYDDLQTDRFATLEKRYDQAAIDLSYLLTDQAMEIAKRDGKYQTVYPNKDGTKQIDLPAMKLLDDPFVIQCFDSSSLPRDPAGRLAKVTDMLQGGLITPQEGRRMLDFPDLEQNEKLANAAEERILKILDAIVEDGEAGYEPPDPLMQLDKGMELVTQYYNLYAQTNLEEDKLNLLRTFRSQLLALQQAAMPPQMPAPGPAAPSPQAVPQPPPQSDLLSNIPGGQAA